MEFLRYFLLVRVGCFPVSYPKKIIDTDMMKLRQGDQNLRRDHPLSMLIVSIGSLGNIDLLSQLRLRQVSILSQIADSFIFFNHFLSPITL